MLQEQASDLQLQEEINHQPYNWIKLSKQYKQRVNKALKQLAVIINKTLLLRNMYLFNEPGNQAIERLKNQYALQKLVRQHWSQIRALLNQLDVLDVFKIQVEAGSEVRLLAIKLTNDFIDIVEKDIIEINGQFQRYNCYDYQIQVEAVGGLFNFLDFYRKTKIDYDKTIAQIQHFSRMRDNRIEDITFCQKEPQKELIEKIEQLLKKLHSLKKGLYDKRNIFDEQQTNICKNLTKIIIIIFLLSLPCCFFILPINYNYSQLAEHSNLWASSFAYLAYRWISAAILQYSLQKKLDPIIPFMCDNKQQACFKSQAFVWCTLLAESTLFLWIFMAYLFFQPTEYLAMAANLLAVLSFCFELGYGFYHMEIIEALIFKCSFYEFAATFVIVSEVVFNSGLFLYFGVECGYNNAYQKLVYLIGTLCIVLIRLSYFYFKAEERQNMAKLKATILETRKKQRQLINQIREYYRQLKNQQNRNYNHVGNQNVQNSTQQFHLNHFDIYQYPKQVQQLQIIKKNQQKKLSQIYKKLSQERKFGIIFFFIFFIQIGFMFNQYIVIYIIDIILFSISLIFLGRSRILFLFDLLKIRLKIIFQIDNQTQKYIFDKSYWKLGIETIVLAFSLILNIVFAFGVRSCFFQTFDWYQKYVLQAVNLLIYAMHSIIIIHSASQTIRYPLSGLINMDTLAHLRADPNRLTNEFQNTQKELKRRKLDVVQFQENKNKIDSQQDLIQKVRIIELKIKRISDHFDTNFGQLCLS